MDTLDSRTLGYFDLYIRRFTSPGEHPYALGAAALDPFSAEFPFTVLVGDAASAAPVQHDVDVHREAGGLRADPAEVRCAPGDTVRWHSVDARTPRYVVRGTGPSGRWGSGRLESGTVYSHLFGLPGEYRWLDPLGNALSGTVEVAYPPPSEDPADFAAWRDAIRTISLVTIRGDSATPTATKVLVGQWVVFGVEEAPGGGMAIADHRLVAPSAEAADASPPPKEAGDAVG